MLQASQPGPTRGAERPDSSWAVGVCSASRAVHSSKTSAGNGEPVQAAPRKEVPDGTNSSAAREALWTVCRQVRTRQAQSRPFMRMSKLSTFQKRITMLLLMANAPAVDCSRPIRCMTEFRL